MSTFKTIAERFWSKVNRRDSHGCWYWTASRNAKGYGQLMYRDGIPRHAHRISWELHNGYIPEGIWVLHRCDVPHCVNPSHLFLGTQTDNMRDMVAKKRHWCPAKEKTHCPHGHPYSGHNLILNKRGWRECRTCNNDKARRYESKHQ